MPKHFRQHGFTDGCAGCRAIEARLPPSNHNAVCRSRMQGIFSKTYEGNDMVEGGYAICCRPADQPLRGHQLW